MRTGRLHNLVSSLQFRLVTGFALTIALTLASMRPRPDGRGWLLLSVFGLALGVMLQ